MSAYLLKVGCCTLWNNALALVFNQTLPSMHTQSLDSQCIAYLSTVAVAGVKDTLSNPRQRNPHLGIPFLGRWSMTCWINSATHLTSRGVVTIMIQMNRHAPVITIRIARAMIRPDIPNSTPMKYHSKTTHATTVMKPTVAIALFRNNKAFRGSGSSGCCPPALCSP